MSPFVKLSTIMLETTSEGYQNSVMIGYGIFSKLLGYYLACIWSAFMVYWIIEPNSPNASWWVYGLALAGFLMAKCVDVVTLSVFAVFCLKPELIDTLYSWVPFRIMYLDYP